MHFCTLVPLVIRNYEYALSEEELIDAPDAQRTQEDVPDNEKTRKTYDDYEKSQVHAYL